MTDYMQLFVGVALLSAISFYAVWTKLRIVILRQQLFDVRDGLWQEILALDALDDPAYRETRRRLNVMIRAAHKISLPSLVYVMANAQDATSGDKLRSDNPAVQSCLDAAVDKMAVRLYRYILYYRPFSGLLLAQLAGVTVGATSALTRWFEREGPVGLDCAAA